jgi:hypothetical protein
MLYNRWEIELKIIFCQGLLLLFEEHIFNILARCKIKKILIVN